VNKEKKRIGSERRGGGEERGGGQVKSEQIIR
jgi:hypothetical protein